MKVKVNVGAAETWISALPESLKHEFSLEELEQMKQQFSDFDTSGDGSIAASELIVLMESMGIKTTLEEVQELIDKVDDNRSGELEYPEFVRLRGYTAMRLTPPDKLPLLSSLLRKQKLLVTRESLLSNALLLIVTTETNSTFMPKNSHDAVLHHNESCDPASRG
ncbi:hypothetical protein PHYBOEH_000585 [Phytophthora boehmeriae]|uniref:EF-hand domain-containing protein n=1 Tax=Phytophthora boehmeriae TaxID=109152 RepID=A0A8T1X5Z4_9STRA|nr:hypothetical protein PHYBOEH_000585 [Phytophthora boehmeriae]